MFTLLYIAVVGYCLFVMRFLFPHHITDNLGILRVGDGNMRRWEYEDMGLRMKGA